VTCTRNKLTLIALALAAIFAWPAATPLRASIAPLPALVSAAVAGVRPGEKIEVHLETTDGRVIDLDNTRGKILVVSFWATSCPHCRAALDKFRDIDKNFGDQGIQVIAICYDHNRDELKKAVRKHHLGAWPHVQAIDQDGGLQSVQQNWDQQSFPHVFILTSQEQDGQRWHRVEWRGHPDKMQRPLQRVINRNQARLMPGRWTSRVAALDILDEIEGLLGETDKDAQIAQVLAGLPLDSVKDPLVVDRAEALLPDLEAEAMFKAIQANPAALPVLEAIQAAVAERHVTPDD